jgi:hypothetical protein
MEAVVSTVTVNAQDASFPERSRAVQWTAVVPAGKMEPDGGLHVTVTLEQASLADGAGKLTTIAVCPHDGWTTIFAGQVMLGGVLSVTVTVKLHMRAVGCGNW